MLARWQLAQAGVEAMLNATLRAMLNASTDATVDPSIDAASSASTMSLHRTRYGTNRHGQNALSQCHLTPTWVNTYCALQLLSSRARHAFGFRKLCMICLNSFALGPRFEGARAIECGSAIRVLALSGHSVCNPY